MNYLWTEDYGAGFHFWTLVNKYLFQNQLVVESKGSNQGIIDAVRTLKPEQDCVYYIAFDIVYDNMDIVNKLLELQLFLRKYPEQLILLDMTCFEYIILSFSKLVTWTGTGRKDKIVMREHLLKAIKNHRIDIDRIEDQKTLNYLMGFKNFSTERVLKSITYELTDNDEWTVKGNFMGNCWYKDCCVLEHPRKAHCNLEALQGEKKIMELLRDKECANMISRIHI